MATILVVDDRPSNRQFLLTLLGYGSHRLLEASNGAQALDMTRSERPDLVITDILMPTMDGYEFVQRLRNDPEIAATPVIFHTATYSAPQALALAKSCGVETVLPKPSEPRDVLAAVSKVIGQGKRASKERRPAAARAPGDTELRKIDDTLNINFADLQAAAAGFDKLAGSSANALVRRNQAKVLTERLSGSVLQMQRIMSQLSALIEVGMEMSKERDPARLVEIFFTAVCDIVDSKYAAIAILDAKELAPAHVFAKGIGSRLFVKPGGVRHGLLETILDQRGVLRMDSIDSALGADSLPAGHPPVHNFLGVAIATEARALGWLYFADKQGARHFDAEDERLAVIMAAKLAPLYENLQLLELIRRHAAKLQTESTERERAETTLREREAGLRRAQLMASLAHVVTGPDGSFESWSETLPLLIGVQAGEMPKSTREWLDFIHPDDRDSFRAKAIEGERTGNRIEMEYRLRRADGAWAHIRQVSEPLSSAPGVSGGLRWFGTLQNVTDQKLAAEALQRFGKAMDASPDSIYLTDLATMRFVYVNKTACMRLGYPHDKLLQMGPQDVLPIDREKILAEYSDAIAAGEHGVIQERPFARHDGTKGWTELHRRALRTADGTLIVTIGRDITERKQAQDRVRRLNRVYLVLSGINALIVRVRDRDELFREACRIAVDQGGFKMAWIGIADREAMKIVPVASAGAEPEFLTLIKDRFSLREDSPLGNTRTARAVREKKAIVVNEIQGDTAIFFAKERTERGIHSMAILPLLVSDEAVGVLALYAGESGFFDAEEMKLLLELAGDIAFALDSIGKRERLDYLAFYDQLTGLANRALFIERVNQSIIAERQMDGKFALAILDIERLRTVNDSLGRQAGDALITQVAKRLESIGGSAGVSRLSADHFALVLGTVKGRSEAGRIVTNALQKCFEELYRLGDTELWIAAKAGVALFPGDGTEAEVLLRNAEAALRKGKEGGERITFHSPEMTARVAENLALENKLRQALEKEEFVLHYQPKVDLEARRIVGTEALMRWNSPGHGLVPPAHFIPLLEETGLILQAGAWALRQATRDHALWLQQGVPAPRIAVNVSAIQLRQRDFVDVVKEAISQGANPTAIDIEITESLLMEDVASNIKKLAALRDLGMQISIDDFGTGYSSLSYLAKLPIHTLKIDRSFIIAMLNEPDTMTLVSTIISLAHSLRLTVVAEGVEQEEQAKVLRLVRCDQMQGYLFSKPVPAEELTPLLREKS